MVWSPTPFGLDRKGCWPSRGSQLPLALPSNNFIAVLPPERPQKSSTQLFKIGRLSSPFPSLFHARLRLLILLLPLMSGNAHPNPGPIFPCSVCAGNVSWGAGVSQFNTVLAPNEYIQGAHYSPSPNSELLVALTPGAAPCCVPACNTVTSTVTPYCSTSDFPLGFLRLAYLHCSTCPPHFY